VYAAEDLPASQDAAELPSLSSERLDELKQGLDSDVAGEMLPVAAWDDAVQQRH